MSRFRGVIGKVKDMFTFPSAQDIVNPAAVDRTIFDFSKVGVSNEGWRMSDDRVLNGKSEGELVAEESYLRWSGTTDTRVRNKDIKRSGYCSVLSPEFMLELNRCDAIEMNLRVNGMRKYMVNLHVDSFLPGEMYQGYLVPKEDELGKWVTKVLPFKHFLLAHMGQVKNIQDSPLEDYEFVKNIGFTIADKQDGEFGLDLRSIRGVNIGEPKTGTKQQ